MSSRERWGEIRRIASEILDVPAAHRPAMLAVVEPPELRLSVGRFVRACEQVISAPTILDRSAAEIAAPVVDLLDDRRFDPIAFQAALAGRYTIERELGRGGMATVYLARDERHRRHVALKVLHPKPSPLAASFAARFQREIDIVARLTHPHILSLHDSGAAADCSYYVMPFVSGESLRDRLARIGRLSIRDTLRILRDVARALAYAHREGIVHRDIKPGNILINQDGDAFIADFGVATALAAARADIGLEQSAFASVFGTRGYAAPEQMEATHDTDHRVDLYALGVTAYEMLCGTRPGDGLSSREAPAAPRAAISAQLRSRRPDVPPHLAELVERLLASDPAERPASASEVLRMLDAVNTGGATRPLLRRRSVMLASVAACALIGVVALLLRRPTRGVTTAPSDTKSIEARIAYQRGHDLAEEPRPGELRSALAQFETAIRLDSTYVDAWTGLANAYTYLALFDVDPPRDAGGRARVAVHRALQLDPNHVEANAVRAHQLLVLDCRADEAERAFKKTLALDSTHALARRLYGLLLHFTGRSTAAIAELRRARELAPAAGAETLLGRVFVDLDQPDSAIVYLRRALSYRRDLDIAYQQLAFAWLERGDKDSSVTSMRRAAALNPGDSAQLAYIFAAIGDRASARLIVDRLNEAQSPSQRLTTIGLAMTYAELGDKAEAFRRLDARACYPGLGVTVGFASLRRDPRFDEVLKRRGLVSAARDAPRGSSP